MFTLRLYSGVSLNGPEGPLSGRIAAPQALAMLAVLAASRDRGVSRDKLIGYFWANRDTVSARHLLSNTLYIIRKALGEESVTDRGGILRLDHELVWSDVVAFERAVEGEDLEGAVELYRGPFLDGFYLDGDGAGEFEHWVEPTRERLARTYRDAAEKLAAQAEGAGDHLSALGWWERLVEYDPYNSRYAVRLVQALTAARDPANALQFIGEFERRLSEDLGMEPDPELRELAEELRREPMPVGVETARVSIRPRAAREQPSEAQTAPVSGAAAASTADDAALASDPRPDEVPGAKRPRPSRSLVYAVGIVLMLIATWAAVRVQRMSLPPVVPSGDDEDALAAKVAAAEPRERIVLADFSDRTPGSGLGLAVTEALRIDLAQSRGFALLDGEGLRLALGRMRADLEASLDVRAARELARREGLRAVITGSVIQADPGLEIKARVVAAETGEVILEASEVAPDSAGIIPAVGRLSLKLRAGIGEPLQGAGPPVSLPQLTTSSLEALRLYGEAVRARWSGQPTRATRLFEEAIAIDSSFAMAHSRLAHFGANLARTERRAAHTRAFRLSEDLPPRERHSIAMLYHLVVRRDVDEAMRSARALVNDYPDDYAGVNWLANLHSVTGNHVAAEFYYGRAIALDSSNARGYLNAMLEQVHLERLDDAALTHERMAARFPDHPWTWQLSALLSRLSGDYDAAKAKLEDALRLPDVDLQERLGTLQQLAAISRIRGELFEGEQYLLDAAAIAVERNRPAGCIGHLVPIALADASLRDDPEGARRRVGQALERCPMGEIPSEGRPYADLARAYAVAGDSAEARALLTEFEAAFPLELRHHTEHLAYRIAVAELALAEGRPADAIREARLLEQQRLCWYNRCDVNAYQLLGRAFELAGVPDSAVVYYEKYVHAPGHIRVWADSYWLGPTYERLAALHAARGQPEDEARYLSRLVDLWENSDIELQPRVEEARQRLDDISSERG